MYAFAIRLLSTLTSYHCDQSRHHLFMSFLIVYYNYELYFIIIISNIHLSIFLKFSLSLIQWLFV